ncbi:hypothetical protein [Mycolicibacterium insubricum]|uniref:hypothetical protein n=1 Tax=Mycolicibacterium insubricum TaxID=444597 RepID=UPI0021F362A6|nr:hypothetical protein [Mycolicibacterium insubricum]
MASTTSPRISATVVNGRFPRLSVSLPTVPSCWAAVIAAPAQSSRLSAGSM